MKLKIRLIAGGSSVSIKLGGAGSGGALLLVAGPSAPGPAGRRAGSTPPATPAMVAKGVEVFLAQGDRARLGAALAEVYRAMDRVRSGEDGSG